MIRLWTSIDLRLRVALVALAIAFLPVAWYLGSPLFINRTVNESFPASMPAAMSEPAAPAAMSEPAATASMPMAESQPASMATTSAPAAMGASMAESQPASMAATSAPAAMSEPAATASMPMVESGAAQPAGAGMPAADAPLVLSGGQFGAIDAIHKGQGQATVYKLPDGRRVLRFEQFKVTNGPDLYVYLSGHPAPRDGEQVHQGGFEIAQLKGNIGDQNYELPVDLDLSQFKSVVIYCRRFSVVFSTAELMLKS